MDEYVETQLEERVEALEEEYKEKVDYLTEALDGYLETVVEEFIEENAPIYEQEIEQEKAKTLLEMFDKMVKIVGVDMMTIAEAKDASSDENRIQALEEEMANLSDKIVEARREADQYLKMGLISEMTQGLTILEKEKFEKLAEMVEFSRDPAYVSKLEAIKETILSTRSEDFNEEEVKLGDAAFKPEVAKADAVLDFGKYV
jgi:cobalamin biosynthesis Mg chelatase CobN